MMTTRSASLLFVTRSLSLTWLMAAGCAPTNGVKVYNTPPTVSLITPVEGTLFEEGATASFTAQVEDAQDPSTDLHVYWQSDLDGQIGEGTPDADGIVSFATNQLSAGNHIITVQAVDLSAASAEDTVGIGISDLADAPTIRWVHPVPGQTANEGDDFEFVTVVADLQDALPALVVTLSSDVDGTICAPVPDAVGATSCTAQLSVGAHTLTASVTDADANTSSSDVYFEVIAAEAIDDDEDGWTEAQGDCDDADPSTHPNATEYENGVDDDCDGLVDDQTDSYDDDGDGQTEDDGDCNDAADTTYTGASEACDTVDNDCDGTVDETTPCYDDDRDGYTEVAGDCDDTADSTYPGAPELADAKDNDCDGIADEGTDAYDDDGDGMTEAAGDCDDTDSSVYLDASESCDGKDNDCDTIADEGTLCYDDDGDGYSETGGDCDDTALAVFPGAPETANANDDDCDGYIDEGTTAWDDDGDCYCESGTCQGSSNAACTTITAGDCDDASSPVKPGATELCDTIDNDCDGTTDEDDAADALTYYADADVDGYGNVYSSKAACSQPAGYITNATDCDDTRADVSPADLEYCDLVDNDCDGTTDEPTAVDASTWYADTDADTYGSASSSVAACTKPAGYVASSTDCDDSHAANYPGATEYCDLVDNDCDGTTDENSAADASIWYADSDSDAYGSATVYATACTAPAGYVSNASDCNDSNAGISPADAEICDGVDQDCDGTTDDGVLITYYIDSDTDGYGSSATTTSACSLPAGYSTLSTDCNDSDSTVNPATVWYIDADSDTYGSTTYTKTQCTQPTGYVRSATDCNDLTSNAYPGKTEACDSIDNDCDGSTDEENATSCTRYYQDYDSDGYGLSTASKCLCAVSGNYKVTNATDCYDYNAAANTAATAYSTSSRGDGSYDYNCDGSQSKQYTSTYSCSGALWICVSSTDGYGTVPSCGSSGTWYTGCSASFSGCSNSGSSSKTQSCR